MCEKGGIVFIGPTSEAIRLMGDKVTARRIAQEAEVPLVHGSEGAVSDVEAGVVAKRIGYPIMVKASAGGGGKGMRLVRKEEDLRLLLEWPEARLALLLAMIQSISKIHRASTPCRNSGNR